MLIHITTRLTFSHWEHAIIKRCIPRCKMDGITILNTHTLRGCTVTISGYDSTDVSETANRIKQYVFNENKTNRNLRLRVMMRI